MKCENCGEEVEWNIQAKAVRKLAVVQSSMFPTIAVALEKAKNYCVDCWKEEVETTTMQVMAEYLGGRLVKEEETA